MTAAAVFTVQANATELRRVVAKLEGLPKVGTHIGGGIHVPMPPTWDGTGQCPPGWTQYQDNALANSDAIHFAAVISPQVVTDSANAILQARLTAPELVTLSTGVAAAVTLDVTWDTASPLASATAQVAQLDIAE